MASGTHKQDDMPRGAFGGVEFMESPTPKDAKSDTRNMYEAKRDWGLLPPDD